MITQSHLKEVLYYDEYSGDFFWKIVPRYRKELLGAKAGCIAEEGYIVIKIDGKQYKAHMLAWLWMTGEWPHQIDHENTLQGDNRWINLRLATTSQNAANRKRGIKNTSGYKGVFWRTRDSKWEVYIKVNGKSIYLGRFDDPKDGHTAYCAGAEKYFGEFARAT